MCKGKVFNFVVDEPHSQSNQIYVVLSEEIKDTRPHNVYDRVVCVVIWNDGSIRELSLDLIDDDDDIEL